MLALVQNISRRLWAAAIAAVVLAHPGPASAAARLPESTVFVGRDKFEALMRRGAAENWKALPVGERTAKAGMALAGTPYKNFTLELDDRIETPCANFDGVDCWTFFEIALASARALKVSDAPTPAQFLALIERDRYRGGRCDGTFTSRLHHLEDWLHDNQKRGLVKDITPSLPGARKLYRTMDYMGGRGSKNFRQLRANPALVPKLRGVERDLSKRGIWYVPLASVAAAERRLQNGDIVCIVTKWHGDYTSHVGLAYRDKSGTLRFLHASKNAGKVILDSRLRDYVNRYSTNAGIMVARPGDI